MLFSIVNILNISSKINHQVTKPIHNYCPEIINTFVYDHDLIKCRYSLQKHYHLNTTLCLKQPSIIEDKPCKANELLCMFRYIEMKYWVKRKDCFMPEDVERALLQIAVLVKNKHLFLLMMSHIIHSTSGLSILDSSYYGEKGIYRSRGIIQLQGEKNYRLASKNVKSNFVAKPDLLATLSEDAIKGSVEVWMKIAEETKNIENLCFKESVNMMKPWESQGDNMKTEDGKKRWKSRYDIYIKLCKCFNENPRFCRIDNCSCKYEEECSDSYSNNRISPIESLF